MNRGGPRFENAHGWRIAEVDRDLALGPIDVGGAMKADAEVEAEKQRTLGG